MTPFGGFGVINETPTRSATLTIVEIPTGCIPKVMSTGKSFISATI